MKRDFGIIPVFNPAEVLHQSPQKDLAHAHKAVRRGGSTNAGKISLTHRAVPVLVLGVPSRYVHSHYNFCAGADMDAATELAAQVIRRLDAGAIRHICRQDILEGEV